MVIKRKVQAADDTDRALRRMEAFEQSDSDMGINSESDQEEADDDSDDSSEGEENDSEQDQSEDEHDDGEEEDDEDSEGGSDEDSDHSSDSDLDDSDKKLKELQKNLSQIPFDKLAEIQEKLGMKVFHQTLRGAEKKKSATKGLHRKQTNSYSDNEEDSEDNGNDSEEEEKQKPKGKMDKLRDAMNKEKKQRKIIERRNDKNKPMEIGSKKPVGRFRQVVEVASAKRRDPRFDSLSGKLDNDLFEKSYGFLKDYHVDEMKKLRELIKKERDEDMKEKLQLQLSRMVDRQATEATQKRRQEIKREHKRKERELVSKGKTPFFLKKSDQKKLELIDKFKQLKDSPKALAKAMEKRRKRNSAKEKTKILGGTKRRRLD
ncbi:rRNA biogenesis protein rrp36 [Podila humilis]|nr:rRNA biogenesis protein rrp36 [Podila humilis]